MTPVLLGFVITTIILVFIISHYDLVCDSLNAYPSNNYRRHIASTQLTPLTCPRTPSIL